MRGWTVWKVTEAEVIPCESAQINFYENPYNPYTCDLEILTKPWSTIGGSLIRKKEKWVALVASMVEASVREKKKTVWPLKKLVLRPPKLPRKGNFRSSFYSYLCAFFTVVLWFLVILWRRSFEINMIFWDFCLGSIVDI